jgi:hypothetical protein
MAVDKLMIETEQSVDLDYFESVAQKVEVVSYKRLFPNGRRFLLYGDLWIYVYWNRRFSQIDFNPSKSTGLKFARQLLKRVLSESDLEEPRIKEIHLKVDLEGYRPKEISQIISPPHFRKMFRFSQYDEHKDGSLESWSLSTANCTFNYGSKDIKNMTMYDAQKRHKLKKPTTRLEVRIRSSKFLKSLDLNYLPTYLDFIFPFKNVKFFEKSSKKFEKPMDQIKAMLFERLVKEFGFFGARKKIASIVPKWRRASSFGKVIASYEEKEIPTKDLFKSQMGKFLNSELNFIEVELLKGSVAISKSGDLSV